MCIRDSLGLIHEGEGVAAKALESLGISLEAVRLLALPDDLLDLLADGLQGDAQALQGLGGHALALSLIHI